MLYIYFFFIGRASLVPYRIYPEITQISDLRFIFSEYEHHYHMMWDPGLPQKLLRSLI